MPVFFDVGRPFSVHVEGERVILTREEEQRSEVDLVAPEYPQPVCPDGSPTFGLPDETEGEPPAPGVSPLDEFFSPSAPSASDGGAS
jgi:hypothetical protein